MVALTDALAEEFGAAKVFRPYRDVRFAKDKTPYKTDQGAFVARRATGWYVESARPASRSAAGSTTQAARPRADRAAIDNEHTARSSSGIFARCEREGFEIGGERLRPRRVATTPITRGSSCSVTRCCRWVSSYGFEPGIHTASCSTGSARTGARSDRSWSGSHRAASGP